MNNDFRAIALTLLLAVASCSSADPPSATCQASYPPGAGPVAPADIVAQTSGDCSADTGECQGTPPCGSLAGRVCDSSKFMTADAAICIARAAGLEPGLEPGSAGLVYNVKFRRVAWGVRNLLFDPAHPAAPDGGSGERGGQFFLIDAVDGAVLQAGQWVESS
jgi:hypothetical protein